MEMNVQWAINELLLPALVVPKVLPSFLVSTAVCWVSVYFELIIFITSGWSQLGKR